MINNVDCYDKTANYLNPAYNLAHAEQNKALLEQLGKVENPIVIDLGCGTASDGVTLLNARKDLSYIGVDKDANTINYAKNKLKERTSQNSKYYLIQKDILHDDFFEDLQKLINEKYQSSKPSAIITAYTFHHFTQKQKHLLYKTCYELLEEKGIIINTDLFLPYNKNHFHESLATEIENIKIGGKAIPSSYMTPELKERYINDWIEHYQRENKPSPIEEEIESINDAGFVETQELMHLNQSRSILGWANKQRNSKSFHQILGLLYTSLGKLDIHKESKIKDEEYATLFNKNTTLRKSVYSYFNLSGATFIFSDNRAGKFVMLKQNEIKNQNLPFAEKLENYGSISNEKEDIPSFAMPIIESPAEFSVIKQVHWEKNEYNLFINNIFEIQRDHQGLRNYGEKLTLNYEPEFLMRLPSGFEDSQENQLTKFCIDDCFACHGEEMLEQIVRWRLIIWILVKYGENFTIEEANDKGFEFIYNGLSCRKVSFEQYFSSEFFKTCRTFKSNIAPEYAIRNLDNESTWKKIGIPKGADKWKKLRQLLDSTNKTCFEEDIKPIVKLFYSRPRENSNIKKLCFNIAERTFRYISDKCDSADNFAEVLMKFHGAKHGHSIEALVPACAYFYYIAADGRAKEHIIVALLRSVHSPLEYFVGNKRKLHSAVVIGLASVNRDIGTLRSQAKLTQLRTFLRAITDPLVDRIFIKSLKEAEQSSGSIQAKKVLEVSRYSKCKGVFILGSFDHKITFYSQQSRALMLVRAFAEEGLIRQQSNTVVKVGIIGAGLSGITASIALSLCNCKVTIIEKEDQILRIQRNATHRYIHPRIADWPNENSLRTDAQLPILNWQANAASYVIEKVSKQFNYLRTKIDRFPIIKYRHTVTEIQKLNKKIKVTGTKVIAKSEKPFKYEFDLVIVAVGYGVDAKRPPNIPEKEVEINDFKNYWEPDILRYPQKPSYQRPRSIAVIGSGDGALIDVVRAAINKDSSSDSCSFNTDRLHAEFVRILADNSSFREFGFLCQRIDQEVTRNKLLNETENTDLFIEYGKIFNKYQKKDKLKEAIRLMGDKSNWDVYLSPGSKVFTINTFLINRLVVFLLIKYKYIKLLRFGKVTNIQYDWSKEFHSVAFEKGVSKDFDIVVGRFGPPCENIDQENKVSSKKVSIVGKIKGLENACHELGGRLADLEVASSIDRSTLNWYTMLMSINKIT